MKKGNIKIIILLLIVIESITLFLAYKSLNSKVYEEEINTSKNNMFAILIEQDDGSYKESSTWPTDNYIYNSSLSGCVDYSGNKLNGALSFDEETKVATVNTKTSAKCYLYFKAYGEAYALYFESDKSLRFVRSVNPITDGAIYNGMEVTKAFTGFEENSYSPYSEVPWNTDNDNMFKLGYTIDNIIFEDKISPKSTNFWFSNLTLETLDLGKLDTSNVTSTIGMFKELTVNSITGLEKLDVSKVTNMNGMFSNLEYDYKSAGGLNIGNWDVSNVANMDSMFYNAKLNKSLNIGEWDVSKVTNMNAMFANISFGGSKIDLSNWDVSGVTQYSNFNSNVISGELIPPLFGKAYAVYTNSYGHNMLVFLRSVTEIKVGDKIEEVSGAGYDYFATEVFTDFENVNYDLNNKPPWFELTYENSELALLTTVDYDRLVSDIKTVTFAGWIKPISTAFWFLGIGGDQEEVNLDLEKLNTSKVTDMSYMFYSVGSHANKVGIYNLDKLDVSNVTNMSYMFKNVAPRATTLNILGMDFWNTSNVTDMSYMFRKAGALATTFNIGKISNWNTSKVTDMSYMFENAGANASYSLDLSGWNVANVKNSNYFNRNVESKVTMPSFK